jgi:hypothetical protein
MPESYRHGLSYSVAGSGHSPNAQKITGRGADAVTVEIARSIARAEFELSKIRRIRVALIARMSELGEFEVRRISKEEESRRCRKRLKRADPVAVLQAPEMPSAESERTAEAVRRATAELIKLDRWNGAPGPDAIGQVARSMPEKY